MNGFDAGLKASTTENHSRRRAVEASAGRVSTNLSSEVHGASQWTCPRW